MWALYVASLLFPLLAAGEDSVVARDLGYENYESVGYPDSRWQFSNTPTTTTTECGSPWRPLLAGVLLGALVKVPLLIAGKLLLLKAAAPLAVAGALLPLGVYSIYRAALAQSSGGSGNSTTARVLPQSCLQAAACGIGSVAPKTAVVSTAWVLKTLEEAVDKDWEASGHVEVYREAYMKGAASKSCPEYPCPFF